MIQFKELKFLKKEELSVLKSLTFRDLKVRYAGTKLGVFWAIAGPILQALVPAIVFSYLMTGRLGGEFNDTPFVVFYFSGFCIWAFFTDVVNRSVWVIRDNASLVTKTQTPRILFSLLPFTTALPNHFILMLFTLILNFYYGGNLSINILLFPIYFLLASFFILGISRILCVLSVFILDVPHILSIILSAWFFLTPILYPPSLIQELAPWWVETILINLNPMAYLVEYYRTSLISSEFNFKILEFSLLSIFCLLIHVLGYMFYNRLQSGFDDVL